jgi:pyruvate dehydrogenase E2 component (dihydrolipoamide acetyltransferase)
MPIEIRMPALSAGMERGTLARWLKQVGDAIEKGEVIAEIETDKATMELEAPQAGRIGQLLVANGADVPVDTVIAVLSQGDEDLGQLSTPPAVAAAPAATPAAPDIVSAPALVATRATPVDAGARRPASSPLARRLAARYGLDITRLKGSGPHGRIVRLDVENAAAQRKSAPDAAKVEVPPAPISPPSPAALETMSDARRIPHTAMRRTIARRLTEAKTTIPHFYLETSCEVDALLALRAEINKGREAPERISVNDFVVKAASLALRRVPDANVIWTDEALLEPETVDISVAVATEGGLITPIVRRADEKSLGALSREIRELAARARENRLRPDEYQGGSFSVSNLGMYGVSRFAAIINPPQSCILAVGAAERRAVCRGDEIAAATVMDCTLSVDHRAVDGALGARWLAAFKELIENPLAILA